MALGERGEGQSPGELIAQAHSEHLVRVDHQHPEPPVRGEWLLRALDLGFLRLNRFLGGWFPEEVNPLLHLGALANGAFFIALVTGILLLFYYTPSVTQAYSSLEELRLFSGGGQFIRSLHRYSSDLCMFFLFLHATQIFLARRFSGPRWLAWVTGGLLLLLLWLDGWLGFWLTWDEAAQQVALVTARVLDRLPIFGEPLTRGFLIDSGVNSLVFFIVFFLHMLLPLGLVVVIWLHISRLNRPRYLPTPILWWSMVTALTLISLGWPAFNLGPAALQKVPQTLRVDLFYLFPAFFADLSGQIGGGTLALSLGVLGLFFLVPLWMVKRHASPALVIENRCNGCRYCYEDCPFNAIEMVPDPLKRYPQIAHVSPDLCVGCGICVGSCNPGAIIFPRLPVNEGRERIDQWLDAVLASDSGPLLAFLCASSAGSDLELDPATGQCRQLPGYRVIAVPCSGWVHPLLLERAAKHGARGILVVGCGADPGYRSGSHWTELRLSGERSPALRNEKLAGCRILFLRFDRAHRADFLRASARFREEVGAGSEGVHPTILPVWRRGVAGMALHLLLALPVVLLSWVPLNFPAGKEQAHLVFSFKHRGAILAERREGGAKEDLLPHMKIPDHLRGAGVGGHNSGRRRHPVRVILTLDGAPLLDDNYPPRGIFGDGPSLGILRFDGTPGDRELAISVRETPETPGETAVNFKRRVRFVPGMVTVVEFQSGEGFKVHEPPLVN